MKLLVVSFKECWQEADGTWHSYGGFPMQMRGICSLFDEAEIMICRGRSRPGGMPLPAGVAVTPLPNPPGRGARRKLAVALRSPYYLAAIAGRVARADVVHSPVPGDIALLGMLVGLALGKKVIGRYCGSWDSAASATPMNNLTRALMRHAGGGRSVMLASGSGARPPAENVHWLLSSAVTREELERSNPDLDRGLSSPAKLIYAGRLSPEKGVDHLIRAMALLRDRLPGETPQVRIVGDGPQRTELEALARSLGCGEFLEFTGQVERDRLAELMADSDAYVHAALTEGQAKAWLDAMSQGLPVVAYDAGGARPTVGEPGERGYVATCGDEAALADNLLRLLTQTDDWPGLRRRCYAFAAANTLEAWSERIGELCAESWGCSFADGKLRPLSKSQAARLRAA